MPTALSPSVRIWVKTLSSRSPWFMCLATLGKALGAVFLARILFILLGLFRLRQWMGAARPTTLRYSYAVGIGLFLTFIGLNQTGIVTLGSPGAPVPPGHLTS